MPASEFRTVPLIFCGCGAFEKLAETVPALGERPFLITGRSAMREAGFVDRTAGMLNDIGIECGIHGGITPEPRLEEVDLARAAARDFRADCIIGLGGGSALDVAKAVAGLLKDPEPTAHYFYHGGMSGNGVPCIAIPSTFGTGTEATPNSVLTDPDRKVKKSLRHECLRPKASMVDPFIGINAPKTVKAESGLDALTQAIEGYLSRHATPISDALALNAVERLWAGLPAFVADSPPDPAAAEACATGSLMAGLAFANSRLGMVHGIVHPLGARYGLPHGRLCGILLPEALRFNREHAGEKYDRLCRIAGGDIAEACATLRQRFGIPPDLREAKIPAVDLPAIAAEAMPSGSLKANPRPVEDGDIRAMLQRLTGAEA